MKLLSFLFITILFCSCAEDVQTVEKQDRPDSSKVVSAVKKSPVFLPEMPDLPLDSILFILSSETWDLKKDTVHFSLYRKMYQDSALALGQYIPDPEIYYVPVFQEQKGQNKMRFRIFIDNLSYETDDEIDFKEKGFVYTDVLNKRKYAFPEIMKRDSFITGSNLFGHKIIKYKEFKNKDGHLYYLKFDNTMISSAQAFFSEVVLSSESGIVYLKLSTHYNDYSYFSGM